MTEKISLTLKVWRQKSPDDKGRMETYPAEDISTDMSFLEMLDVINEELTLAGRDPIAFDHDCREGICGMCGIGGIGGIALAYGGLELLRSLFADFGVINFPSGSTGAQIMILVLPCLVRAPARAMTNRQAASTWRTRSATG